jgi:hypothetical protein
MTFRVDLTPDERTFVTRGLGQWGGPARGTEVFAVAMGFDDLADFHASLPLLRDAIGADRPLGHDDWRRALLALELVFASDVVGAGQDWSIVTGWSDAESIAMLRAVQGKVGKARYRSVHP